VGNLHKTKRQGEGIWLKENGVMYWGNWKDDVKNGFGKEIWPNGDMY
jgi:hypothetical protein